jgi:PTH1 family peptidyl-tRNA hydrolase
VWLVVGLGNPGPGYAGNRHNIGKMVVNELASRASLRFSRHKAKAEVAVGRISPGGPRLVLATPMTFMNVSGAPVAQLARFYKIDPENIVVVHDELDIPFDSIKLKRGGGHGGHNGVRDIATALGTPEFVRVRVGIGRPPGRQDAADFVLKDFSPVERTVLPSLISDAADAVEIVADAGLPAAQLKFHTAHS